MPAAIPQDKNPYDLFNDFGAASYINIDQQTFLGASIRSFSANGGFGDTSSTLNVDLVVDEKNNGDGTSLGTGQDVYHNGSRDNFRPPPAGSPVFFTLGQTFQNVGDVFKKAYDTFYGTNVVSDTDPYYHHFYFGGILQSYVQTRSPQGNPLFSAQVVDPREILASTSLLLNNYNNSVFNQYNLINVFGFLEFNTSSTSSFSSHPKVVKSADFETLSNQIEPDFSGNDIKSGVSYGFESTGEGVPEAIYGFRFGPHYKKPSYFGDSSYKIQPMTGTGFSRRTEQGMPYYRICHALNALFGHYGSLPSHYLNAGFFSGINFRGLNYVVDLSDLPNIPPFYYFDYDQITLLDLCLEVAELSNHDIYVSLLPVIDHTMCQQIKDSQPSRIEDNIVGIIKVSAIDRSKPFKLSQIKSYIDNLPSDKVSASDVGYELTNNVTDKVIVGANEVNNYYFKGGADRSLDIEDAANWTLNNTLWKGIIPYYGLLSNKAVTLPIGEGSYQQIMLDSSGLNAYGVGRTYVATEMELRAALISFESWKQFLMSYNDIYMEIVVNGDIKAPDSTGTAVVTVPRCAYPPAYSIENGFQDGFPKNPCHPPLGYPLYWHRATEIGVPQAGLIGSAAFNVTIMQITAELKNASRKQQKALTDSALEQLKAMDTSRLTTDEKAFYDEIIDALKNGTPKSVISEFNVTATAMLAAADAQKKRNMKNVLRIYNFVKGVADECLGKKFLIKIPQTTNRNYNMSSPFSSIDPFGFPAKKMTTNPDEIDTVYPYGSTYPSYLIDIETSFTDGKHGALVVNKNPFKNVYQYNYSPEPLGGYFPFNDSESGEKLKKAGLLPYDISVVTGEHSRILPYAIFSNSQNLSLSSISTDEYTQQSAEGSTFTVDYAYQMDNSSSDVPSLINSINNNQVPNAMGNSTAFVTCSIDNRFYMPPSISDSKSFTYYGDYTSYNVKRKPRQYTDEKTGKQKTLNLADMEIYEPTTSSAGSVTIKSIDLSYLLNGGENFFSANSSSIPEFKYSTSHVYVLLTLPGRIEATVSAKFRDVKELSDQGLKHNMMLDVTHLFSNPPPAQVGDAKTAIFGTNEDIFGDQNFDKAFQKTSSSLLAAFPNQIAVKAGSPIYPDFVSIPLMSHDRSYGPWMSSYELDDIIGGHIEFIKDEQLAPWNYAGYTLMNNAGNLMSEFGSTAQLTSERGSITLAGPPSGGVALGAALIESGPIVSTINVDISDRGVTTVYKMDQFTASFGKLNKNKEKNISSISREKQKLKDERNALMRKNLGKNATSDTYSQIYKRMRNEARERANQQIMSHKSVNGTEPAKTFVLTANNKTQTDSNGVSHYHTQFSSSILDADNETVASELVSRNPDNQSRQYGNSVSCNLEDFMLPASMEPKHTAMSSAHVISVKAHYAHYNQEESYPLDQITYWRVR